jgi:ABC-type phosphate transport system substrate-binding protein
MRRGVLVRIFTGAVFALVVAPTLAAAASFKVVVNAGNSINSVSTAQLARIYLKQETVWPSGQGATPVDLVEGHAIRQAFSQYVLHRDTGAVRSYWQRQIFSGNAVPPPEKISEDDVLAFVRANPGGVGYVAEATPIPTGVRVITVTD